MGFLFMRSSAQQLNGVGGNCRAAFRRNITDDRFPAGLKFIPFLFGQPVEINCHAERSFAGSHISGNFARTVGNGPGVGNDAFDQVYPVCPAAVQLFRRRFGGVARHDSFVHFLLENDFKTFVRGTGFRRIGGNHLIEENAFAQIPPAARRIGETAQFAETVNVVTDSERSKADSIILAVFFIDFVPAERMRNDFRTEIFRMPLL